ncbi:MAG: beta-N-acetylglucosaminidase domain-containing protein [Clostridia bacterium]|nr:beta-N-acetylglucosaminidase domain-containing protein [Clostridia bacterium]
MIYPVLQKNNLTGAPVMLKSVKICGSFTELARKIFNDYGIDASEGYKVVIKLSDTRETTYIDELRRLSAEKYVITVKADGVIIEAATEKGAFRGINTLCKLIKDNSLCEGIVEDYPTFETRGYIEGFYGPTWEHSKRLSVMSLMARYGMNTYFYAPKDDAYHREKWRELYPEKDLADLKSLVDYAKENYFDFNWCIGPGLSYKYTSEEDFNLLISKIKSIYDIGVRGFGLLLDDIPWEFQYPEDAEKYDGIVDAHVDLINKAYEALKAIDSTIKLTVCPTQYSGDENGYYITKFGKGIPSDVSMFWTGEEICSRVLTVRESQELFRSTDHKPLFWDNYPVNDCEMFQEMHLGAIQGRDKELYKSCEGLISNVMEYAECSKIPLMTIADYLWNPVAYNPDASLENAHREMLGDDTELFSYFADHLGVSCLTRYSSAFMSNTLARLNFLVSTGEKEQALKEFSDYNGKMRECLALISDDSKPIFAEMKKWVNKFSMCCDLLDAIRDVWASSTDENTARLAKLTEEYNMNGVSLTGFCLREAAEKTLKLY